MADLLREGLDVVFCGTAKGAKSAAAGTYYADKTNRFWRVLHEVGLTDCQFRSDQFQELLPLGIGFTDLNQKEFGTDSQISMKNCDVDAFRAKMITFKPKVIAFTSLQAGRVYLGNRRAQCGEQSEKLGAARIVVLPSTSGLNGHWSRDAHHWHSLPSMLGGR